MPEMLITFDSTQQALRAETLLEYAEIEIDICPTPKSITAGCALSIEFPQEELERVRRILREERVEIRGIYRRESDGYVPVEEAGHGSPD
jgi:predicted Zn-dependent peptidase